MTDKQIIFILDDNRNICEMLTEYLKSKLSNIDIFHFDSYQELKNHEFLNYVSLFIFDIHLNEGLRGDDIALEIFETNPSPFLFMSGKEYSFESFEGTGLTYDYITKPFNLLGTLNRIKVLLKVSKTYKQKTNELHNFKISLKELFDYTNIYMIILDSDLKVRVCSSKLAKDLGFEHEDDLINKSWLDFLTNFDQHLIKKASKHIITNSKEYQSNLKEVTNEIISKDGTSINVKWFNSRISNGKTYSFSIGIPYKEKLSKEVGIEEIRHHWKEMIDRNKTTLKAIKSRL